jgi:hypothetical protein
MRIRAPLLFTIVSLFLPALAAANGSQFQNASGKNATRTFASALSVTSSTTAGGAFRVGGLIVVADRGSTRLRKAVIFRGTFNGRPSWIATSVRPPRLNHRRVSYDALYALSSSGPIYVKAGSGRETLGTITQDGRDLTDEQEVTLHLSLYSRSVVIAVPEPGTAVMLGIGLSLVAGLAARRTDFKWRWGI